MHITANWQLATGNWQLVTGDWQLETLSRRDALKTLGAAVPILRLAPDATRDDTRALPLDPAQGDTRGFRLSPEETATLGAIAEVVLPSEADRGKAVRDFTAWIANYREGADTDHGYGNTRVRPTGPSPARNYPPQIAALDAAARAQGAAGFAGASPIQRRTVIEAAFVEAKIERLPARPTGAHIASDLMGHYFNSPEANDLCYRAFIGRDACRGLTGSDRPPSPLAPPRGRHDARPSRLGPRT